MATCFVIQPFDRGVFDKRYEDVLAPAIVGANLEPYRVDRDPAVSIPIDQIEGGIRASEVCLAEITTDNPNVWFELGFAIASQREVVLVCCEDRQARFPFDVQHRNIITYAADSPRDFEELRDRITKRLKAILAKEDRLGKLASRSPIQDVQGLSQHEVVALVAVGQNTDAPGEGISTYVVRGDMNKAGFTRIATTLALTALSAKGFLQFGEAFDQRSGEPYITYTLTDQGMTWLLANQDKLVLQEAPAEDAADADLPF